MDTDTVGIVMSSLMFEIMHDAGCTLKRYEHAKESAEYGLSVAEYLNSDDGAAGRDCAEVWNMLTPVRQNELLYTYRQRLADEIESRQLMLVCVDRVRKERHAN